MNCGPALSPRRTVMTAVIFFTFAISAQAQSGGIRTRVVTYNLHHGQGLDSVLDLARIARILKLLEPDIAGLQEIDSVTDRTGRTDQPAEYAKLTGMRGVFGRAQGFRGGSYGNLTLSKTAAKRSSQLVFPWAEPRMALITDIDLSGGANPSAATVTFINTHLMFSNLIDPDAAMKSAKLINAFALDVKNGDPDRPMILVGDMNANDTSPVIAELRKIWKADGSVYGVDWIFFRPAYRWKFLGVRKIRDGEAPMASDHLPVRQEMELLLPVVGLHPRGKTTRREKGGLVFQNGILLWVAPDNASVAPGLPDMRGRHLKP